MKVYFHEDQVKDDAPPGSAVSQKILPTQKSKRRGIVISPLISVVALIAIGIGAFAYGRGSGDDEKPDLTYTPVPVQKDQTSPQQPGLKVVTTVQPPKSDQQEIETRSAAGYTDYDSPLVTSTGRVSQPKSEETTATVPTAAKQELKLPPIAATARTIPKKVITAEPAPEIAVIKENEKATTPPVAPPLQGSRMERARILFGQQKYYEACALSRLEMSNGNKAQRHEAVIMTAQCYLQLGYKPTAQHLLEFVVSEGGPGKKNAKRILEESRK